jgi:hypothetical protein
MGCGQRLWDNCCYQAFTQACAIRSPGTKSISANGMFSPVDPIFRALVPLPSLLVAFLMSDWLVQEPP